MRSPASWTSAPVYSGPLRSTSGSDALDGREVGPARNARPAHPTRDDGLGRSDALGDLPLGELPGGDERGQPFGAAG